MQKLVIAAAALGVALVVQAADEAKDLGSADEQVRIQAASKLAEAKAAAIPGLISTLDGNNATAAKMAGDTLFKIVQKAAGTSDAKPVADALAAELTKRTPATREQICEQLGFVGAASDEAVTALARSLGDKDTREAARRALVRIASPSATAALVENLTKADPEFQIALLNGLTQKRDPAATPAILKLSSTDNQALRQAAWSALAKIGAKDSLDAFTQAVKDKKDPYVTGLLFDYADALLDAGNLQQADTVLKLRQEVGPLETLDTCRLLRAHARLGTPESIELILPALENQDPKIRGAAFEAAAILPGTEVTRSITQQMIAAKGQAKVDMLNLLGKRGNQMDDRTVMLMYMAMLDKDDAVKIACIRAMQQAGVTSTLPTLLNIARGPAGPVADAAIQALGRTSGANVTQQIIDALTHSSPEGKARLLDVLAVRGEPQVLPVATRFAGDPDAQVRAAAFNCLGRLGAEEAYDTIVAGFDLPAGPDRDAAERAMNSLKSDLITAKLLAGYFDSPEGRKPSLLRVLSTRQLEAIDALLVSESKSSGEPIREAAIQGLSRRAKPAMAQTLLDAFKAGPANISTLALAGYCNVAKNVEATDKPAAGRMLLEALKLATTDEQRNAALSTISRIGDPATPGLLDAVLPLMQGGTKAAAESAVAHLAALLPEGQRARAVELLQKLAENAQEQPTRAFAKGKLREWGVK